MQAHTSLVSLPWQLQHNSPDNARGTSGSRSCSLSFRSSTMSSSWSSGTYPSPMLLPEIITLICSYLSRPDLAVAARFNRTWSKICLPLLYREISLNGRRFKIDSLELGIRRSGHFCLRLQAARDVNHWCSRIAGMLRCTPNLIDLDATWMNVDLLESLVFLQKLERLAISRLQGCYSEDSQFFEPFFQGSSRIRELNMADSSQMTDSTLVSIIKTSPHIQALTVSGNQCLTHQGLIRWCEQLSKSSSPPLSSPSKLDSIAMTELTTVNFANCNRIQPSGYRALFEHSRNLQHVNLMSTRVDDDALQVLANQNQGLENIILNCCPAISDHGLQAILRACRQLKAISLLYCNRISARIFFQSQWKCRGLEELRFSLNGWHQDLIEHGLEGGNGGGGGDTPAQDPEMNPSIIQPHLQEGADLQSMIYEPQLEFMIFGEPEWEVAALSEDDDDDGTYLADQVPIQSTTTTANNSSDSHDNDISIHYHSMDIDPPPSFQEYRQRLILTQLYRQIGQFTRLQTLVMRSINLPLNLNAGLSRLSRLKALQRIELAGLEQPFGPSEVNWLAGISLVTPIKSAQEQKHGPVAQQVEQTAFSGLKTRDVVSTTITVSQPLPMLRELAFIGGYSLSSDLLRKLKEYRPQLDIQLTQVRDAVA